MECHFQRFFCFTAMRLSFFSPNVYREQLSRPEYMKFQMDREKDRVLACLGGPQFLHFLACPTCDTFGLSDSGVSQDRFVILACDGLADTLEHYD